MMSISLTTEATLHIKFPYVNFKSDLYKRTNEIPLSLTVLKNRWKLFSQILRLHPQTPAQQYPHHLRIAVLEADSV